MNAPPNDTQAQLNALVNGTGNDNYNQNRIIPSQTSVILPNQDPYVRCNDAGNVQFDISQPDRQYLQSQVPQINDQQSQPQSDAPLDLSKAVLNMYDDTICNKLLLVYTIH